MKIEDLLYKRKNPLHLPPKERTRQNLQYVLEYLPILADLMPQIRRDFNIKKYGCYENSVRQSGPAGSLLGNIPRLFELKPYLVGRRFSYGIFSREVFPYLSGDNSDFLFNEKCHLYQHTFYQAIERINHLLKSDLEIEDFRFDKDIKTNARTPSKIID